MRDARQAVTLRQEPTTPYTSAFYEAIRDGSTRSAAIVVPLVLDIVPARSMVDVGCVTAAWAAQFRKASVETIDIDGGHVDLAQLQIPRVMFVPHELEQPISLDRGVLIWQGASKSPSI